jgi:hypothetical protein
MNLKTVKLASCRFLDALPTQGNRYGPAPPGCSADWFRCRCGRCRPIALLIDERPEEVTDMARSVVGEVISSTFDGVGSRVFLIGFATILR